MTKKMALTFIRMDRNFQPDLAYQLTPLMILCMPTGYASLGINVETRTSAGFGCGSGIFVDFTRDTRGGDKHLGNECILD